MITLPTPSKFQLIQYPTFGPRYWKNLALAFIQLKDAILGNLPGYRSYFWAVGSASSSVLNATMGRYYLFTVSAYTGYKANSCRRQLLKKTRATGCQWLRFERAINAIPFFSDDHCYRAAVSEGYPVSKAGL